MKTILAAVTCMTLVLTCLPALGGGPGSCSYPKDKKYLKEGKLHGKVPCFTDGGTLSEETTFRKGVKHGPFTLFGGKGTPLYSGSYKNGERHGPYTEYLRDGRPRYVTSYKNGKRHGRHVEYCVRGKTDKQIKVEGEYRDGQKRHGTWKEYDCRSGMLDEVTTWKMNKRHGVQLEYHFRSDKLARQNHWNNGERHGPSRRYDKNGTLTKEQCWQHGRVVKGMQACKK